MFRSVLKTLHDQRRGLIGWSIGLRLLVFIEAAVWPSMKNLGGMDDLYPRLVLEKALALFAGLAVLGSVLVGVTCLSSWIFDLGIGFTDAVTGAISMVLLGSEFGAIALAAGTLTGRRATAIAVAGVAALAAYVLYATGLIIDAVEPWRAWSPFDQALAGGPLGAGLPASYLFLAAGAAVSVLVAMPVLSRRDIAARV